MSTFGSTPHSGPGASDNAPVDPATSPDTEPDTDSPPTQPSVDASELDDEDGRTRSGNEGGDAGLPEGDGPEQISPGP
jgi:hypothetical protein